MGREADVEANKAVVNRFLHEPKGLVRTLSDDVCWTLVGNAPMCGTYRGKAEAIETGG